MMQMFKSILIGLMLGVMSACSSEKSANMEVLIGETMGTTYTIKYLPEKDVILPANQVKQEIDTILDEVNRQMSTYQEDSEISQFNRMVATQELNISDDFAHVIVQAIKLNQLTEGALDVTVGPIVNLWGFGPDKRVLKTPSQAELDAVSHQVGLDKIQLKQDKNNILFKKANGVYLDLSAIAKGFGVDKVAQYLEQQGIQHYLVEIGGEVRAKGNNANKQAWQLGIEQPQMMQGQEIQVIVPLQDESLATSGDYRNFRTDESGRRLSHIINPKTQEPINHRLASVSVIADNATTADGLATGLFVLGEKKAMELAEKENLAIFLIIKTEHGFERQMSSEFKKRLGQESKGHKE